MQATKDCTPSERTRLANAFSPAFLAKLRGREEAPTAREAVLSGPWEVEPVVLGSGEGSVEGPAWAVVRRDEPMASGGRAFAVFLRRSLALLTAAVLPSLGTPSAFHLKRHEGRLGYALHHGREFLGHVARDEEGLLPQLRIARSLAADPEALARLLEAAGPEALAILGRTLHRRVG